MPLTDEQKRTVEDSINHLLDFPENAADFRLAEQTIRDAVTGTVDESNEFFPINQCITQTEVYLHMLEQQGPAVTIGEVQEHIIKHITARLQTRGHRLECWNTEAILLALKAKPEWTQTLKSKPMRVENWEHPYELPNLQGKIYSGMVGTKEVSENDLYIEVDDNVSGSDDWDDDATDSLVTYLQPIVHVTVTCTPDHSITETIEFGESKAQTDFANDTEEEAYINSLKPAAQLAAEDFAAEYAVKYLQTQTDSSNANESSQLSAAAKLLLTHAYYLEQIIRGEILLSDLDVMNILVAGHLTHPHIIQLLRTNFCQLRFADLSRFSSRALGNLSNPCVTELVGNGALSLTASKAMDKSELTVATHPVYFPLLKSRKISEIELFQIGEERCKFLILPPVSNLILLGRMSFRDARYLPLCMKPVFISGLYSDYFRLHEIPWHDLRHMRDLQCQFLLNKYVVRLVANGLFTLTGIANMSDYTITLLQMHPKLLLWMEQKLVTLPAIENCDPDRFYRAYCNTYVKRLYALSHRISIKINDVPDTLSLVMAELPGSADDCCVTESTLKNSILFRLISMINIELNKMMTAYESHPKLISILKLFLAVINQTQALENENWSSVFEKLVSLAYKTVSELRALQYLTPASDTHFSHTSQTHFICDPQSSRRFNPIGDLKNFCEGLLDIALISPPQAQLELSDTSNKLSH